MKNIYVIAGCNGAGKTTASHTILPEILHCREFINADEIAKGLSPFEPEKVAIEAGRIMLERIDALIASGTELAFETTLATKSHAPRLKRAQKQGYLVTLLFFWLRDVELAKERVHIRVSEGGHNVADDVIERRYYAGIKNMFNVYTPVCDNLMLLDNSNNTPNFVMQQVKGNAPLILDADAYSQIRLLSNGQ
jgi:predicted ABC-type ATPase